MPGDVASVQPCVARYLFPAHGPFVFVYNLKTIVENNTDIKGQANNATES
jgi:hypothetical protein